MRDLRLEQYVKTTVPILGQTLFNQVAQMSDIPDLSEVIPQQTESRRISIPHGNFKTETLDSRIPWVIQVRCVLVRTRFIVTKPIGIISEVGRDLILFLLRLMT